MFKIIGSTMHLSRGDKAEFNVTFRDGDNFYEFKSGDVLTFSIFKPGKFNEYLLQKNINISQATTQVKITLSEDETRELCDCVSYPIRLNYDVVLNNKYSVICYDDNGIPALIIYPRSDNGLRYVDAGTVIIGDIGGGTLPEATN